jgi:hypothetical protein
MAKERMEVIFPCGVCLATLEQGSGIMKSENRPLRAKLLAS